MLTSGSTKVIMSDKGRPLGSEKVSGCWAKLYVAAITKRTLLLPGVRTSTKGTYRGRENVFQDLQ